jgi:predicted dehydrogenase
LRPVDWASTDGSTFPKAARRLRIGFVGGGRISRVQAMAIRLTNRWDIVAGMFSTDPRRAKTLAADWSVAEDRFYSSYSEMVKRESARTDGIDAVTVVTRMILISTSRNASFRPKST